jgi:hypothetical protein
MAAYPWYSLQSDINGVVQNPVLVPWDFWWQVSTNPVAVTGFSNAVNRVVSGGHGGGGGGGGSFGLWAGNGYAIYPSGLIGTNNGWIAIGNFLYPQ